MKRAGADDGGGTVTKIAKQSFNEQNVAAQIAAAKANLEDGLKVKGDKKQTAEVNQTKEVKVSPELIEHLMTVENRSLFVRETGSDVEWLPQQAKVKFHGSAEHLKHAVRMLAKVELHCHWGVSDEKIHRILKRRQVDTLLCRLSPTTVNLRVVQKTFGGQVTKLSIGKDKTNDVIVEDGTISRHHCVLSFEAKKGCVYAADLSTNGTFLNGKRLPSKKLGKVMLSHGDELLLKNPSTDAEFGFICNLQEISVREETKLVPLRKLTPEDLKMP